MHVDLKTRLTHFYKTQVRPMFDPETVARGARLVVDRRIPFTAADLAKHYQLDSAPDLVAQVQRAQAFLGADTMRKLAAAHPGDRGTFLAALVIAAERKGLPQADLTALQASIPTSWLKVDSCPFCHPEGFKPSTDALFYRSANGNFIAAPNVVQLFNPEENGGHVMLFPDHHRSTPSATPQALRSELTQSIRQVKAAMEDEWGKPVSLFANGMPGADPSVLEEVDSHAHVQLFTGDATIADQVAEELRFTPEDRRNRILPVDGLEDYFRLYDEGKLRGRYLLTLDPHEKGAVILIGDQPTPSKLAARNVRKALGEKAMPVDKVLAMFHEDTLAPLQNLSYKLPQSWRKAENPDLALSVASRMKRHFPPAEPAEQRAILAAAPVPLSHGIVGHPGQGDS